MVIYDVYEELEKPDEREILFINRILDEKFGFSSYEEMEDIFHQSCKIKNDNSNVIIDEVSYEDVTSLNMVDKFQLEEKDYTHCYNQSLLSKENDVNSVTKVLLVSHLLARNYESFEWQGDLKNIKRTFQYSRNGSFFHTNEKRVYFSTTPFVLFGYILLTSKLLMLLIYLQMLKREFSQDSRTSRF